MEAAKLALVEVARQLGFSSCRVARREGLLPGTLEFRQWLEAGCHGKMEWMARGAEKRENVDLVLAGCRSVVSLGFNYFSSNCPGSQPWKISRYAWAQDYHDIILEKLGDLNDLLELYGGVQRYYVDTGPVLERNWAAASGNGWTGKSGMQIHPKFGTWFFLAEILTTLELEADLPLANRCGNCQRCQKFCPTGAIGKNLGIDARKCLSYWLIENPGPIPLEIRPLVGGRIYGCDTCQDVCPWNKFAQETKENRLMACPEVFSMGWEELLQMDQEKFSKLFARSPIKRIKLSGFLRNVCVAFGNCGNLEMLPFLKSVLECGDENVVEHAQWAYHQLVLYGSGRQNGRHHDFIS